MKQFIQTSLLRQATFFVSIPFFLFHGILAMNHPDFSGEWKLNESRSELGNFGSRLASVKIKIVQYKDSITFTKTRPNGETDTETLSYDGKESVMPGMGGTTRKSTAKWSDDGQFFVVNFVINTQNGTVTGAQNWSLSEDKLYIETAYSTPQQGDFKIRAVYDKQ